MRPDERELDDEIRAHLALEIRDRIERGEDPDAARVAALREFGYIPAVRDSMRRVWYSRWFDAAWDLVSDARYAGRTLARNPGFALTVIAVLTLGVGLNVTVFSMLKGCVLSPLSGVPRSSKLAVIVPETSTGRPVRVSYPDYQYLRQHDRAFTGLFGAVVARLNVGRGGGARQVWGEMVTGNYFHLLGVQAQLGRTLQPSDEIAPGRHPVVVISDSMWRRDFHADAAIIGTTLEVNNQLLTVVGVAVPRFYGTTVVYDVGLFIPVVMAPDLGFTFDSRHTTASGVLSDPLAAIFYPQGFLSPDVTRADASSQIGALWTARAHEWPAAPASERVRVVPFFKTPNGAASYILPTLGLLTAMGLLVLLIVCANVAGLVMVRGVSRRGEIAVRLALGASRRRIVRLLVIENFVLATPGALLGVLLAHRLMPWFVGYAEQLARPDRLFFNIDVDAIVITFAALTAGGSALAFGFVPALQSSRVDLVSTINADASPRGAPRGRWRSALVIAQVAVSVLLLVGAGLVTRSLEAARHAYPGFDPNNVASIGLDVRQNGYDERRGRLFYRTLLDAARADGTIESATLAFHTPMGMQDTRAYRVAIDGYDPRRGEELAFMANSVASDYFHTLRIPVLAGREFDDRDGEGSQPVVIVNATLAERFWGSGAGALGKRLRISEGTWRTVVGVVADVKYARINEGLRPYVYLPFQQSYRSGMVLHTRGSSEQLLERSRALVTAIDPDLPVTYARPMVDQLRGALIFFNLAAAMLFLFGVAGMMLAAMGTYGLVSYTVRQSTHEIGIRLALGASRASIIRRFLARGLRYTVVGALLGIVVALGSTRLLGSVLFGVSGTDAVSFLRALGIVGGGVLAATLVAAWRAARTSPLKTLRHQ